METTEPKKEITNEFLLSEYKRLTEVILNETDAIRAKNNEIWDHLLPTYGNVKLLYDITKKLEAKIDRLISDVDDLNRGVTK